MKIPRISIYYRYEQELDSKDSELRKLYYTMKNCNGLKELREANSKFEYCFKNIMLNQHGIKIQFTGGEYKMNMFTIDKITDLEKATMFKLRYG